MVDASEWDRYDFKDLEKLVMKARDEGKYCFIQDCHGETPRFFQYKGLLVEFGDEVQKA